MREAFIGPLEESPRKRELDAAWREYSLVFEEFTVTSGTKAHLYPRIKVLLFDYFELYDADQKIRFGG